MLKTSFSSKWVFKMPVYLLDGSCFGHIVFNNVIVCIILPSFAGSQKKTISQSLSNVLCYKLKASKQEVGGKPPTIFGQHSSDYYDRPGLIRESASSFSQCQHETLSKNEFCFSLRR